MNVNLVVVMFWLRAMYTGTDAECYSVCCEFLVVGNIDWK